MSDLVIATEPPTKRRASGDAGERGQERGRSPGLSLIFWLLEQRDSTPLPPHLRGYAGAQRGYSLCPRKGNVNEP